MSVLRLLDHWLCSVLYGPPQRWAHSVVCSLCRTTVDG
jgi:hypothetical protein